MTTTSSVLFRWCSAALTRGLCLLAIASVALATSMNAMAQDEFEELVPVTPMLGLWQHGEAEAIEIAEDRHWRIQGGQRVETSEAACPISFEYLGYLRSGDDILFPFDANGTTDAQGKPLAARLRAMLGAGPYLTLTSACCCAGDINRGAQLIQIDEANLVGVFWREGVFDLQTYTAAAP